MAGSNQSIYNEITETGRRMLDLGRLALTQVGDTDQFNMVFVQLNQREMHYARLQELVQVDGGFQWAHLEDEEPKIRKLGDQDGGFQRDLEDGHLRVQSQQAYETLQAVLQQNAELEQAVVSGMMRVRDRMANVDQRRRLEHAYHPSNYAPGVWSQTR